MTIQHAVVIFRKSKNTNSFGLRGYWAIEASPTEREGKHKGRHRVWEFATSNDLQRSKQALPFFVDSQGASHPAYELPTIKGSLPAGKLAEFLADFNL